MRIVRSAAWWTAVVAATFFAAGPLQAQTSTKMPSTLRWGSGHVDVPSAAVLPHMTIAGTYSGFLVNIDDDLIIGTTGQIIGTNGPLKKWYSDGSVSVGLFDRAEVGAVLHSIDDNGSGNMLGAFGQLALLRPSSRSAGLGLAVGGRFATSPDYDSPLAIFYAPNRLGIPDANFLQGYGPGTEDTNTNTTLYAVASAFLKGVDSDVFPDHDVTVTLGWGTGTFAGGDDLPWYSFASSKGLFGGATVHSRAAPVMAAKRPWASHRKRL